MTACNLEVGLIEPVVPL